MKTLTKSKRLANYKKVLEYYRNWETGLSVGMCIVFGELFYGGYVRSPWIFLPALKSYYPELTTPTTGLPDGDAIKNIERVKERISIIEAAIEQLLNASGDEDTE